ncbi:MAG: FKBP-type peptidyl-prolyl cis-trans isomerase, partial [bacterium]
MRKTLALFLALSLTVCLLAACGQSGETETPATTPAETSDTNDTAENTTPADTTTPADEDPSVGEEITPYEITYDFYSAGLTDEGFFEGVTASEIVTLPPYKGLSIPKNAVEVSDEEIWAVVAEEILPYYAERSEITDRAIVDGDTVNIDYVGYVDDVAFDGGDTQGMGTDVTIGVTQYIDDFLEQLIGHTPGENFDIFVTFPEDYGVDNLNGQEARFNITINHIVEQELPQDLTDEMAVDMGYESRDALLERVAEVTLNDNRSAFLSEVVADAVCEEIPDSVIQYFGDYLVGYYSNYYGYDFSSMREEMMTDMGDELNAMAKNYLALQAIAEVENLRATDADLEAIGIAEQLDMYGVPFAHQAALSDKVIPDFIVANGTVEEA